MNFVETATKIGIQTHLVKEHKAILNDTSRNKFQKDVQHAESELRKIKDVQA